jgi:hypothetical protein
MQACPQTTQLIYFPLMTCYNIFKKLREVFVMSKTFEHRLSDLIHEIKEIKKEIILDKLVRVDGAKTKINKWKTLSDKISSNWDSLSAADEVAQQREKTT